MTPPLWPPNTFNNTWLYPNISFMGKIDRNPLHPAKRGMVSAQKHPVKDRLISGNGGVLPLRFFPIITMARTSGMIELDKFTHGCASSVL